jgi:hypothetical protein
MKSIVPGPECGVEGNRKKYQEKCKKKILTYGKGILKNQLPKCKIGPLPPSR